ncbi:(2Fe-2S)-binding protein [Paenibacillus sp. N3.4]|uniref:(2Fe-2S)-binding protein n=1 Tax=Paenibacillus sp. N3.4 TaxID=2603222 RepID=UPI0011CA7BCF|nr:(2Fe-2S)-binding protein [Paenibacillus sp. N3.4]TXK85952.1 (2Fe-2S)-binding protein [Paenibacillus sp. N3.4]
MTFGRIQHHPVLGTLADRKQLSFQFDRKIYTAYESETIAAALLANGVRTLRVQEEHGTPRGIYCNIGHCFECRVTVNGEQGKRACLTLVEDGMAVLSGVQFPTPFKKGGHQHD